MNNPVLISNNGDYYCYQIAHELVFRWQVFQPTKLVLESTRNSWKREFQGITEGFFSGDGKKFCFQSGDSLFFVELGTDNIETVLNVSSYKQPGRYDYPYKKGEWLAFQLTDSLNKLIVRNLLNGQEQNFSSVSDYSFDATGHTLIIVTEDKKISDTVRALKRVDLSTGTTETIWSSQDKRNIVVGGFNIDTSGDQVVFTLNEKKGEQITSSIWYFKTGMEKAIEKVNDQTQGIDPGLKVADIGASVSLDSRYIFFQLKGPEIPEPKPGFESVDLWSYKDTLLQPTQLQEAPVKAYQSVISVEGNRVIRLERDYEKMSLSNPYPVKSDFVIVRHDDNGDRFWQKGGVWYDLVSLVDGSRKVLNIMYDYFDRVWFTPEGNHLIYYKYNNYFSYEINSGRAINISKNVPNKLLTGFYDEGKKDFSFPAGLACWIDNDKVLVYDEFDIWKLDLLGKNPAINITNGYGRKHQIKLLIANDNDEHGPRKFLKYKSFLLTAFNTVNKYNGFYRLYIDKVSDPDSLIMGPWTMDHHGHQGLSSRNNINEFDFGMIPLKAVNSDIWIVRKSTPSDPPNLYLTSDFKSLRRLTDFQRPNKYNWLTTELITYKQADGKLSQGVLYKPEDFNPKKRYPLILNYYEKFSYRLYEYPTPYFCTGDIDIPWFVSRGYLVFTPDINYHGPGKEVESVCNSVISAAQWLAKFPYVDGKKMAINGHSHGGSETNYLITHSNLFAAVLSCSGGLGASDWVASSLSIIFSNANFLGEFESYHAGASLWQRPDIYIRNSPVMRADKITSPILIMHNKTEGEQWEREVEFFIALRRLGKKAWMLQYDNASHNVFGNDAEDFTIRATQFFDHYLKGAPPPKWMTRGIPARLKGVDAGLELDYSGMQP